MSHIKPQVQETLRAPSIVNAPQNYTYVYCIIFKLKKSKDKEKFLKEAVVGGRICRRCKECKKHLTYRGIKITSPQKPFKQKENGVEYLLLRK